MTVGAQDSSLTSRLEKNEREERSLKIETDKAKHYGKFPDMSWRDHLVMLLQFGAAAEHCLMVEYLYAAYSLRTDDEDAERRAKIERWRGELLSVAREEMGHLLTVQNVLLLLGARSALDGKTRSGRMSIIPISSPSSRTISTRSLASSTPRCPRTTATIQI